MPVTAGTSTIRLQSISDVRINNIATPANSTIHDGNNVLDGIELKIEKGESVRVASGKDRALSEKITMSFEIVEALEADLVKLLACNNAKCNVTIGRYHDGSSMDVTGFLSVNQAVTKMVSYKCMMEITAEDADSVISWYNEI